MGMPGFSNWGQFHPLPTLVETLRGNGPEGEAIAQRLTEAHDLIAQGEALGGGFASAARRHRAREMISLGQTLRADALSAAVALLGTDAVIG